MRGLVGCLLGALASVPVCAIAAPAQKIELTDAQALAVSDMMLNAGDLPAAESLLNDILQSDDVDIRIGALFQLGRVAAIRGNYDTAERYFLTILKFHPDMTPVRLELAQVYILTGQYGLADFNLRLVLADKNLPTAVAERVRGLINAARQRKNWSVNAGLSLVPDSNINNATGRAQECINFGFGVMCRLLERENSGIGLRYSLGGDYYLRLTDHWGIKNSAHLSALDFATSHYDDYSLYLASGPRYLVSRGEVSLQPFAQMRWYAGKYYSTVPGLRLDTTYDIARRVSLAGGISFTHTKYHDGRINDIYRSNEYTAYIQPRYYMNSKSFVMAGVSGFYSTAAEPSYGYKGQTYSVGYFGELPLTLTLYARLDLTHTKYHEPQFFIMRDYSLDSFRRRDWAYQAYIRLSSRLLEYRRIYPSISYTYTRRDSNAPAFEFDKHRVEVELNYRF